MISRVTKVLSQLGTPAALLVIVVILGMSFVAVVLVPGLELASEVADSSTALKLMGDEQRQPTIIRAALESAHDRLDARGYVQESLDELRAASNQLDTALREMTKSRPASWVSLTADTGAVGAPIAGKHSAMLLDTWAREQVVLKPLLEFRGVPYQDNESTGTNFNESGRQLERDVSAALRTSHHTLPLLDSEFNCHRGRAPGDQPAFGDRAAAGNALGPGHRSRPRRARVRHARRSATAGKQPAPGAAADHRHSAHGQGRAIPAGSASDHRLGLFRRAWKRCSSARISQVSHSRIC